MDQELIEIDVVLLGGETLDQVIAEIKRKTGATAQESAPYNSAYTLIVSGTPAQIRSVRRWHNASHKPRPDLVGKPPVAKGQKR